MNSDESKSIPNDMDYHLEELKKKVLRVSLSFSKNIYLVKIMDAIYKELETVQVLNEEDPRFIYKQIQRVLDRLYLEDDQLTGCTINFDWNTEANPNRAIMTVVHKKVNDGEK